MNQIINGTTLKLKRALGKKDYHKIILELHDFIKNRTGSLRVDAGGVENVSFTIINILKASKELLSEQGHDLVLEKASPIFQKQIVNAGLDLKLTQ
jgi:anti-anti-sigma regulatory factor